MTEHLQREPDGVPHAVIGFTAYFCVVFAMLLLALLMTGTATGKFGAVVLGLVAIPSIAAGMQRKATRDRDDDHPPI
jgi:hypothetical protein